MSKSPILAVHLPIFSFIIELIGPQMIGAIRTAGMHHHKVIIIIPFGTNNNPQYLQDGAPQADVSWFINQACALDHISINALLGALARAAQWRQALQISTQDASKEGCLDAWVACCGTSCWNKPAIWIYIIYVYGLYMVYMWFIRGLYVVYIWFIAPIYDGDFGGGGSYCFSNRKK
jgi:hypothetical protein